MYLFRDVETLGTKDLRLDDRHHDDNNQHANPDPDNDPHTHVFPPHLLAHAISASSEALGRDGEGVCWGVSAPALHSRRMSRG